MDRVVKIKIIIPINDASYNEELREVALQVAPPDMDIDVDNIKAGNSSIESRWDRMTNAPHVVEAVVQAERDGYDGVFVSDFDFCGVEEAREVVSIPVIGGFRPSVFTAMALGDKFSILTITDSVRDLQASHLGLFGIERTKLASIIPINLSVHELTNRESVIEKAVVCSKSAIEDHKASAILFGCTGFMCIAAEVKRRLLSSYGYDVPVIDPNHAAVSFLNLLVRNQLSQSRTTYLPPSNR
ncbi:aspartate/glutamate racemase family protein [Litoribrevibacter albus]|uniref:Racemase n=1 Tax=Litoribrevibacter albus TaxID=1473156 RepID=A0AA37S9B2_9GAMM|nr:aspartate/glutamate racemase family protein [Litoribrevibacter albus]GLQ30528.1 racemase [Litoribrevibacter albus]